MKKVLIIVSVVVIALAGIGVGAYFLTREKVSWNSRSSGLGTTVKMT